MPRTQVPEEGQRVVNVSELKNTKPRSEAVIRTEGESVTNDGLSNLYWWDPNGNPSNADGKTIIESNVSGYQNGDPDEGVWRRMFKPSSEIESQIENSAGNQGAVQYSDGSGGFLGNTGYLYVDNLNGNVGIGDNSPDNKLEVVGSSGIKTRADQTSKITLRHWLQPQATSDIGNINFAGFDTSQEATGASIKAFAEATWGIGDVPTNLRFYTANAGQGSPSERIRISASGDVGIGTTTPSYKLDVNGDINAQSELRSSGNIVSPDSDSDAHHTRPSAGEGLSDNSNTFDVRLDIDEGGSNVTTAYGLNFGSNIDVIDDGSNKVTIDVDTASLAAAAGSAGAVQYASSSGGFLGNTSYLYVDDSNGNVGIGTSSPQTKLDVEGLVTSGDRAAGRSPGWIGYNNTKGFFAGSGSDNAFFGLRNRGGSGGGSNAYNAVVYWGDDGVDDLEFRNEDNGELGRFTGGGLFGIGTSSPSYALDVNGDINAQGELRSNGNIVSPDNDPDAHHTRPSAGDGIADNSNTFDVRLDIDSSGSNVTSAYALNFSTDINVIDDGSNQVTIEHANTGSDQSTGNSGQTFLQNINTDGRGHVNSVSTKTINVDNYQSWTIEEGDGQQTAIGSGQKLEIYGGNAINTEITSTGGETRLRVSHNNTGGAQDTGNSGGTVIQNVNTDGNGHVTGVGDITFSAGDGLSRNGYTFNARIDIDDSGSNVTSTYNINFGSNLNVIDDGSNQVTVEHADSSNQGNVSTSGATVIDDINVDGDGHVTNMNTENRTLDQWDPATSSVGFGTEDIVNFAGGFDFIQDSGDLVLQDSNGLNLIRQPEGGPTQFIQGAEIGSIEAPEDSLTQVVNAPSTSAASSGDPVGYTFSIDNQSVLEVRADADGSGGITNKRVNFSSGVEFGGAGDGLVSNSGTLDVRLDINDGGSNVTTAYALNFGNQLNVIDDGSNQVTVEVEDGSNSGLDADTLDGIEGSNYARTDIAETFNDDVYFTGGNVGIGTSSPSYRLDVTGTIHSPRINLENEESANNDGDVIRDNSVGFIGKWGGNTQAVFWDSNNVSTGSNLTVNGGLGQESQPNISIVNNPQFSGGQIGLVNDSDVINYEDSNNASGPYWNNEDKLEIRGDGSVSGIELEAGYMHATQAAHVSGPIKVDDEVNFSGNFNVEYNSNSESLDFIYTG